MKKLCTGDLFSALRLVKATDMKKELTPIIQRIATEKDKVNLYNVGIEGMLTVIESFSQKKAETQFYEWLAGPLEMDAKDIANMDMNDFADLLVEFIKGNDFTRFFKSLGQLLTKV